MSQTQLHYQVQSLNTMQVLLPALLQFHTKQVYNALMGYHPDTPLTFHVFVDSSSAIVMMNSDKVTRKAWHIERRIHFVRQARAQGVFIPHKVPGERNPADVGTKNLNGAIIVNHMPVHPSAPRSGSSKKYGNK